MNPSPREARASESLLVESATRVRFQVSAWLSAAAAIAYVCRNSLAVAESTIRADLGLSEEQMGWILGPAFFWTYALAQVPTASCGQRWGSRHCLALFSVLWSVATAAFGISRSAFLMLLNRGLTGIAQAGLFPCSTTSIALWHPPAERATASGLLAAAMSVGGAVGAALTGWLLTRMAWESIFLLYAVPGLIWGVGFWMWFRNTPSEHPATNEAERRLTARAGTAAQSSSRTPVPWCQLLVSRKMWLISCQQFFRAAGYAFFASWFATYLQEARHITTAQSGWLTTLPLLAIVLSSVLGGKWSDFVYRRTGSLGLARRGVAGVMLGLCAVLVVAAYFIHDATTAVVVISIGVFCSGFAGPCAYAVTMDMGGKHVATVFSIMNMVGNFGAGLLPWIIPHFKRAWERSPQLLAWTNGSSWDAVLFLFAATYVLAALCWFLLRVEGTVFDGAGPRHNEEPLKPAE